MEGADTSVYRPPAPDASQRVHWPDAFGTRFTVFVDTEEEFDWDAPFSRDRHGTAAMAALPAAHARFVARGVPATYLVTYPIVADPRAVEAVQEALADGQSAVGTQLHPWVAPPFDEPVSVRTSFAGNLPEVLEAAKLDRLGAEIARAFGAPPLVYRAGRYGLGPSTLRLLAERGYRIDSSMRSAHCYAGQGGPDYRAIGNHAFRTGPDDALVELPLTTVFTGAARRGGVRLHDAASAVPGVASALSRARLFNRVPLTPEGVPVDEALEAIRVAVGEGVRLLMLSYHSPSLACGHTPYVRDAADLAAFWQWWDAVFDLLDRLGVRPASLDAIIAAAMR